MIEWQRVIHDVCILDACSTYETKTTKKKSNGYKNKIVDEFSFRSQHIDRFASHSP